MFLFFILEIVQNIFQLILQIFFRLNSFQFFFVFYFNILFLMNCTCEVNFFSHCCTKEKIFFSFESTINIERKKKKTREIVHDRSDKIICKFFLLSYFCFFFLISPCHIFENFRIFQMLKNFCKRYILFLPAVIKLLFYEEFEQ